MDKKDLNRYMRYRAFISSISHIFYYSYMIINFYDDEICNSII